MRSNQAGNWRRCLLSLRARIYHGTAEGESHFSRAQVTTESYDAVCTFSIRSALSTTAAIHGDAFYILVMWFFWYIRSETCPTKYRAQVLGRCTPQKSLKKKQQFLGACLIIFCAPSELPFAYNTCDPEESSRLSSNRLFHCQYKT